MWTIKKLFSCTSEFRTVTNRGKRPESSFVLSCQYLFAICAIVAVAVAYAPTASAQIVIGPTVSLASLTNDGGDVLVGDKDFSNFSISGDFSASQINVTSITINGDFGIRFSGAIVSGSNPMDMILGYKVAVTNSPNLISKANLLFNGTVTGTGLAEVVEQVFTNNNQLAGQMFVFASTTTNKLSDSLAIQPPQPFLTLSKDVIVTASLPAFASISTIDQTFTQVPEPSALALVAAGFTGMALLRRRRR
ncbi:MAG TPA: PEP-CTERM sorting domain-containing protein [Verrucomicrobiae bacterium]|nr:PEP-CTERM sorting domain-containing protein [Verrucomicrobiae bacterium]